MPARVQFTVTDRTAPRRACDPAVAKIAGQLRATTAARTPVDTGNLAGSWRTVKLRDATYRVMNDTWYGRFVEYGTRHARPRPALGRTIAEFRIRYGR